MQFADCAKMAKNLLNILSNCGELVKKICKDRHDAAKMLLFASFVQGWALMIHIHGFLQPSLSPFMQMKSLKYYGIYHNSVAEMEKILMSVHAQMVKLWCIKRKIYFWLNKRYPWCESWNQQYKFKRSKYSELQTYMRMENRTMKLNNHLSYGCVWGI